MGTEDDVTLEYLELQLAKLKTSEEDGLITPSEAKRIAKALTNLTWFSKLDLRRKALKIEQESKYGD